VSEHGTVAVAAMDERTSRNNKITALVLVSIVAVFFFGIMLKYLLLR
jgi:hypothetical protein